MNTRQKLTLGIAAIFMVTLTIVGVTYAYFVTRIEGDDDTDIVDVQTATVGDIVYKAISTEPMSMDNALPGTTKYYQFSVANLGEQTQTFQLFYESSVNSGTIDVAGKALPIGEYIHSANGVNTGDVVTGCYGANQKMSGQLLADNETDNNYKTLCFSGAKYNNFKITLYDLGITTIDPRLTSEGGDVTIVEDDVKDYTVPTVQSTFTSAEVKEDALAAEGVTVKPTNDTQVYHKTTTNLVDSISINGKTVHNYVLKVEYLRAYNGTETPENELIQNAENLASLNIKVDIK